MSMNPRVTTDKIRQDYTEYITSILTVRDKQINALARQKVRETEFVKGPYLETTPPFTSGKSLKELAEEGLISKEFEKMGKDIHYTDWKLRIHQENALRKIINEKENIIVSTGTGSGKTECYLYPVFNELMRQKEAGTLDAGVRALLLFPMNALANDQQKKLRKLLRHYPDITFGRYTGETQHMSENADKTPEEAELRLHKEYDQAHFNDSDESQRTSIPNEMMCREMMAKKPPHILLTNYAMLEYMLLRPDTAPFFDNDSAGNWQFIIIDEAHTYKGAQGTEIAFLLRRLKERIRHSMHKPFRCIATSATLGSEEGKEALARFAQTLFDEPFAASGVITTKRLERKRPADGHSFSPQEYTALKEQTVQMSEKEKSSLLYRALCKDYRLFTLYENLKNRPKRIEETAEHVFPEITDEHKRESALIDLIELAAAAKETEDSAALLPARYHLFIRSLEGMFVRFLPQREVFLDRREKFLQNGISYSVFELANCQKCSQEYLVGKINNRGGKQYFTQTGSHDKPDYLFITKERNEEMLSSFDEDDTMDEAEKMGELKKYHLCLSCGRVSPFEQEILACCQGNNLGKVVTVMRLEYRGKDGESNCCPCCGATKKGLIMRFLTANQPATVAIAKSLYDAIPPRPTTIHTKEDSLFSDDLFAEDDLFGDEENSPAPAVQDESGRKLLIFSDNRQEAAFFAGFFEKHYRLIMWRKIILQCLRNVDDNKLVIDDLIKCVLLAADKEGLFSDDPEAKAAMTDLQKREMAAHYVMQEFMGLDTLTGLEGLGYVRIEPVQAGRLRDGAVLPDLNGEETWSLLAYMMDTLRKKGAYSYPEVIRATDGFFAPQNRYAYFRKAGSAIMSGEHIYGFMPSGNSMNKRLALIRKLISGQEISEQEKDAEARARLGKVYDDMCRLSGKGYLMGSNTKNKETCYCLNYKKWQFRLLKETDTIFRCKKCGKVFGYSIRGLCPELKCDGKLEQISAADVSKKKYYDRLYSDPKIIPMAAKEHTAQLAAKTAGDYQKYFEEGYINILSCSTTFEMGVDVGELEATFQRNVPPETSNYIQRAGRAGRRTSSAAFSVTFSRRNSHDMTFFRDPPKIIAGKISAPVLKTENDKIATRHLNSIVIAWFFKQRPEFFQNNTGRIIANENLDDMAEALREKLKTHPAELLEAIHSAIPAAVCSALHTDEWAFIEDLTGENGSLVQAIEARKEDMKGLRSFRENLNPESSKMDLNMVNNTDALIRTLETEGSISFLSSKGILPKYGFPIDSVSLEIISGDKEAAKKIDLSRDLKLAISEYAPPASVVADGKLWESYAVKTIPNKSWPTYMYYVCPGCGKISHGEDGIREVYADPHLLPAKECPECGEWMHTKKYIIPIFGFSTSMNSKPKPVGDARPKSYYATKTQFWGIGNLTEKQKTDAQEMTAYIGRKPVQMTYSPGGRLFVLNQGINNRGVNICPECGYATDPALMNAGKAKTHKTKYGRTCKTPLINVSLGTVSFGYFETDFTAVSRKVPCLEQRESKEQDTVSNVCYPGRCCRSLGHKPE